MVGIENKYKKIVTSGKRKAAIARATIIAGSGIVKINNKDYENMHEFDKLKIEEVIRIAQKILGKNEFDVNVFVKGGGEKGQVDAVRVAIARAIIKFTQSEELEKAYLDYDRNMLVADVRRKEAYKPGDSKARANRQTSYR